MSASTPMIVARSLWRRDGHLDADQQSDRLIGLSAREGLVLKRILTDIAGLRRVGGARWFELGFAVCRRFRDRAGLRRIAAIGTDSEVNDGAGFASIYQPHRGVGTLRHRGAAKWFYATIRRLRMRCVTRAHHYQAQSTQSGKRSSSHCHQRLLEVSGNCALIGRLPLRTGIRRFPVLTTSDLTYVTPCYANRCVELSKAP